MKKSLILGLLLGSLSACQLFEPVDPAPEPLGPIPSEAQMAWHKLETYAFVHFGLNTYNDLEWGYGNTPASTFAPDTLDVEQWASTLKRAGMKGIILTAKHHDGFCLWPTKTTDYSVKASPWQGGRGDLVRDLSDACRRHGLKFGLYLSPWDRNNAHYGTDKYREIFHEQIRELTTGYGELFEYWFDGANGGTGWYGGADEARSIDPETYYQYHEAGDLLRANNPDIMIFGGTEPTIRWVGNESGWAGETNYAAYDPKREKHHSEAQWGMADAQQWLPSEVDVSIRPGWFYHKREDHQVRSVADLTNLYYQSVGRGANLLLNCPINLEGRIPVQDSTNLIAWYEHLKESFSDDLFSGVKPIVSNSRRGRPYRAANLTDGDFDTYWATADSVRSAEIIVELNDLYSINNVMLQEYIPLGQRVEAFEIYTRSADAVWTPINTMDSLTTIGYKRIVRFQSTRAEAIKIKITKARGPICLAEIRAFRTPTLLEEPEIRHNDKDELVVINKDQEAFTSYSLDGKDWTRYEGKPLVVSKPHTKVGIHVYDASGKYSIEKEIVLGYPASMIATPTLSAEERSVLLDGNGFTVYTLPKGQREITLELPQASALKSFVYIPDQRRDATGHIQKYQLYLDGKLLSDGEFANIRNNPIPVSIDLPQGTEGKRLRLVVLKTVEDTPHISIGGLALY